MAILLDLYFLPASFKEKYVYYFFLNVIDLLNNYSHSIEHEIKVRDGLLTDVAAKLNHKLESTDYTS